MRAMKLVLVCLGAYFSFGGLFASRPYTPLESSPFDESWRWTELEALAPYTARQVDEAEDGALWFAVLGGIVRFDGYEAIPYLFADAGFEPARALAVKVASDGRIYVVTNLYSARFDNGEWFQFPELSRHASSANAMVETDDGSIWVAAKEGLYRIVGDEATLVQGSLNDTVPEPRSAYSVGRDRMNRLWVSDLSNDEITRYTIDPATGDLEEATLRFPVHGDSTNAQVAFHEDHTDTLWIAVQSKVHGLRRVDGDTVTTILPDLSPYGQAAPSLSEHSDGHILLATSRILIEIDDNKVKTRRLDQQVNWMSFFRVLTNGRVVTGGHTDKAYIVDTTNHRWTTFHGLNFGCQEADGVTWMLSEDKRVVRWNPAQDSWISFGPEDGVIDQPNAMLTASDGRVWVSGSHGADAAVAWWDGVNWSRQTHPQVGGTIAHVSAFEGNDQFLYFGLNNLDNRTKDASGGVIRYRVSGENIDYQYLSPPQVPSRAYGMAQDNEGSLWMGGQSLRRKREGELSETIDAFHSYPVDNVAIDSEGFVWVGDWRTGISRLSNGEWERFDVSKSRIRNQLVSLHANDSLRGVWALTTQGLNRFDGDSWSPHVSFLELLFQREGSNLRSTPNGRLWINVAPRSWNFNLEPDPIEEGIVFQTIRYGFDQSAPETRIGHFEPRLLETGNAYIQWAGFDKWSQTWQHDLAYSFRLNGGDWSPFAAATQTSIPSLDPGQYRLEVRSRDSDWNIDPTPAIAEFTVVAPLWKRPWFIAMAALIVATILILAYLLVRQRIRHLIAIEEFKIDFFTKISHELRTPLAVILGPLERVLKGSSDPSVKEDVSMAYRNARKMRGLVNQLLEFRKVELGKLKYEPVRGDIAFFLKDAIYAHAALWERKQQKFNLELSVADARQCYDPDKLQHIVSNLLSNAIKYTPSGGEIEVAIEVEPSTNQSMRSEQTDTHLTLQVSDTGVGIAANRQELIFKPFYRAEDNERNHEGSGIGLAYTYELVKLWGGEIGVESPISGRASNAGTRFTVRLPLTRSESAPIASSETPSIDLEIAQEPIDTIRDAVDASKTPLSEEPVKRERPLILLVEDNSDVRQFLAKDLSRAYDVIECENGAKGIQEAKAHSPDVIVTDLMMPEMDGLEMCSRLKTDLETSHIPIVVLTARGSKTARLEGIEHGADDYFSKPVDMDLLLARIGRLLESRRQLRALFTRQIIVRPKEITVTSTDEQLLEKAIAIVEENMSDETFDVERFAELMGLGRASLYRKLSAIVDQSPSLFIRSIRLKRAAQLLASGSVNVSEATEQVGISAVSHFGKIFRDEFGISPSEYRKRHATAEAAVGD